MRRLAILLLISQVAMAQKSGGEFSLTVRDSTGGSVQASGRLTGIATGVERSFHTDEAGSYKLRALPFGRYRLLIERSGFASHEAILEIQSENPLPYSVTLGVAPISNVITVNESETMLDPARTSSNEYLSPKVLQDRPASSPGRSFVDLVNGQPGWLLEANGVLHPRGSEYDVQYVIDGVPLYDNRSPAFAQSLSVEEFSSLSVRTAGYPAEFGRKLGGVIEAVTQRDARPGVHGAASLQNGSFGERSGFVTIRYSHGETTAGISGEGMITNRYLDPPVENNYTNHASGSGISGSLERDWSASDRTRVYLQRRRTGFLVPNEELQQLARQRQDRVAFETMGQAAHTHIFSPRILGQFRVMSRDTGAELWSNSLSTPIVPSQDRGFRETYAGASISAHFGGHEMKTGTEASYASLRERFAFHIASYRIGTTPVIDRDIPRDFSFAERHTSRDQSFFVQDLWRMSNLTVSAGLRFDHHQLRASETAWSPRLGAAYFVKSANIALRASYDRVFQVPAMENLLLASSNLVSRLGGQGAFAPLKSSRGDFVEAGFSKSILSRLRLDGNWFRRKVENFADDSLLLNTGVSFPIAFHGAEVHGFEAKIEVASWGPVSGWISYSNMLGVGRLPVAGGLFLGDETTGLTEGTASFQISQDQRNSLRSRIQVQPHSRFWFAFGTTYDSGLPFEIEGPGGRDFLARQYGSRILQKVNFENGRVRPSASLDVSVGVVVARSDRGRIRVQTDVFNIADRLNLVNFSGAFSGTAVAAPRNFAVRMQADF